MVERAVVAGALLFVALVTAGLGVVGWSYRSEPGARWFTGVAAISSVLICMDTVELLGTSYTVAFAIEWLGTALYITIPVVWFGFILSYAGYGEVLSRRRLLFLSAVPGVSVLSMVTMEYNALYFRSVEITREAGQVVVDFPPGPLAYLALLYSYALFVVGLAVVVRMILQRDTLFSGQALWLLVGALAPMIGGLLTAFGPNLERVFPPFPAGLSIFTLAFGYGLFRHRIFDLTPATRTLGTTTAVQSLDEGIVVLNTNDVVVTINEGACALFGCDRETILGNTIEQVHPALTPLDEHQQPVDITHEGRVFEATYSTVHGMRNQEIGRAVVVRDVTTQRSQKQRLSVLNRVLRHNLRNDLMVVQAFAQELTDKDDQQVSEHADRILRKTDDLVAVAEKARKIQENFDGSETTAETVALESFFDSIVRQSQSSAPDVPVDVDVPSGLTVTVDTQTLELVVQTLVENAVTYGTPADGYRSGGTAPVRLGGSAEGETLKITVADDGPGIPPEEYGILASETESQLEHGSGLGLWLAKWGTSRLGGDITFETDSGTTVSLLIPLN